MNKTKVMVASMIVASSVIMSANAAQLSWASGSGVMYDTDGTTLIPTDSTYLLQMYESSDNICDFSAGLPGAGETLRESATWNSGGEAGYFAITLDPLNSNVAQDDYLYTVIWNTTTGYNLDPTTRYAIVEGTPGAPSTTKLGMLESGYDPTSVGATGVVGADWQPVPEPGTMAMFGLGAVLLALRKKLRK
jgi:hypothetical protein